MNDRWILLDFDGIIVDSKPALNIAYNEFLKQFGINGNKEEFDSLDGPTIKEIVLILKKKYSLDYDVNRLLEEYRKKVNDVYDRINLNENIEELLNELTNRHFGLGVVTSSDRIFVENILEKFSNEEFFKIFVFGNEVKVSKPDPEIYKVAIKKIGGKLEKILAIEDSDNGYSSAINAGIKCKKIDPKERNILEILSEL